MFAVKVGFKVRLVIEVESMARLWYRLVLRMSREGRHFAVRTKDGGDQRENIIVVSIQQFDVIKLMPPSYRKTLFCFFQS